MDKRIIFTTEEGLAVIIPSTKWEGTIEELAEKDVPEGCEYRIVSKSDLPSSRNWRSAWTDKTPTETVDIDLEKAKVAHKQLMIAKMHELTECDEFGQKDMSITIEEIKAIDFDAIDDLQTLYNTWASSIDRRTGHREYKMHESK